MHRTSELKVSAKPDRQIVESTFFAVYRKQVRKRLSRVVVSAVAGVYHRNACVRGRDIRRALFRVAHRDYICIAAYGFRRIGDAFSLARRRRRSARNRKHVSAQLVHRRFKAEPRSRGRLEKQRSKLFAMAHFRIFLRIRDYIVSRIYKFAYILK